MPTYIYKAKDRKGLMERGSIEAIDKYKALELLQAKGLVVTSIKEAEEYIKERKRNMSLLGNR